MFIFILAILFYFYLWFTFEPKQPNMLI